MRRAIDDVWAAGDAVLPVDPGMPPAAVRRLVDRLRPAELRRPDGSRSDDDAPDVPDGTALVVATSGSTGAPKGVVISHATLRAAVDRQRRRLGARDGQPWLGVLPLHHVAGLAVLLRSRAAGVEPSFHRGGTGHAIELAPPSWISLVPTQLDSLLEAGVDLARHHGVLLGGAAAPPQLLDRARAAGVSVTTSYGMTETCGGCVYDGRPLDDVELRVEEDGVLAVRGPVVADGLRTDGGVHGPLVDADGWLRTNDLAALDADGRLVVLGRADDVVVSGGDNVPLAPVRRALRALPAVADADVVGLPDDRWGTAVTAVVVPVAGHEDLTLAALRDELRGELPPTHLPTRLELVGELPRDGLGKVTAAAVRAVLAGGDGPTDDPPGTPSGG